MEPIDWAAIAPTFFDTLASTGNVSEACRAVDVCRDSAYEHRKADAGFSALWDEAIETSTDALDLEARRRALFGTERPVFYQGEECGRVREYSDTLMVFLLKAHRPEKYRENVKLEHAGGLTIKVEYVDSLDSLDQAPETAPGTGDDPPELPSI
jgi:hypothetical protein